MRIIGLTALLWAPVLLAGALDSPSQASPSRNLQVASLTGKPVVGRNADGYLEVFRVEPDGELRHRWQNKATGDWSSWASLGGAWLPGIALATDGAGRLVVFSVDPASHALHYLVQQAPNSRDWSGWMSLEGNSASPVTVGTEQDGRLEVFAVEATNNKVSHRWQTQAEGGWSAWTDLGGNVLPGLALIRNRDGRLELFGVEADTHTLVHCWQTVPNAPSTWSEWVDLGGCIQPGFAVGCNVLGLVEVFAVNRTNGKIERLYQATPGNSRQYSGWQDFGPQVHPGLAVGQSADGRMEVLAVAAADATLLHRWETRANGSDQWSTWASLETRAAPYPAVGQNEDGNLEVFAVDVTNPAVINHRRQVSRASNWLDWASLDQSTFEYSPRIWTIDEGLPDNQVQAIAQSQDGYLWVGTHAGLARFDGVEFRCFGGEEIRNSKPEIRNKSECVNPEGTNQGNSAQDAVAPLSLAPLLGSSITALCADRQGALWIGTEGSGVMRWQGGSFTHFGKTSGLAGDGVRSIYERRDGSLWIGTTTGLSRYERGRFANYTKRDGLSSDMISSLFEDRDNHLWIATGEGLSRLQGQTFHSFTMPNRLPGDSVRGICQDKGGRIWIGSNNGMLWFNSYWTNFFAYNTKYGISDRFVSTICEDREGNLWVGTYSGLNRFRGGRFFNELNHEGNPFDRINALFEDREGNLWVGSREGLIRLTPKRFFTYTRQQQLPHNNVMAVLEDRAGSLWAGTWGGGLSQLKDARVTAYLSTNVFSQGLVLSLCEGRDGSLWLGSDFDGGLAQLKQGKFTYHTWKEGFPNAPVRVLHEDRSGALWLGTDGGLSCLRNGQFTDYTAPNQLGSVGIRAICEDQQGRLWFGTERGLSRWEKGAFHTFTTADGLSDNSVTALYEDAQQTLWIGTSTGGLNRSQDPNAELRMPNAPLFRAYSTRQGLFSDEIFEILEDDQGWLWMSCSKGVFRVRKAELNELDGGRRQQLSSLAYGKTDGMESSQCNGAGKPAGWKSRDGRLWFATSKGLVAVDPKTTKVNHLPPPVYIERVVADRKDIETGGWKMAAGAASACLPVSIAPALSLSDREREKRIRVPPGRGELEFHYTALHLRAPEASRFKYQLEGVDLDWVEAGTRRQAYYNHLAPGHYRFRVQACNKDGVWNEQGAVMELVLEPHWWQTWWWRGALALLVIGGASGTGRYLARKRLQRKLELLEQRHAIEQERGRIAKDIHDDLGSSLTRIMMLGERAEEDLAQPEKVGQHVRKIVATARQTVQTMDEIVWAVNPDNDTLEGLVEYISHYANEFFENTTVSCRLEMPVELPALLVPAEVRHDLFLVVKEAFNNVLKHAQANAVRVQVTVTGTTVEIDIEDNGCGFGVQQKPLTGRKGNGLGNMRKRIAALGGQLEIVSAPGVGTQLKMRVELAPYRKLG